MFKMRCQVCGSTHTKKNGMLNGAQLWRMAHVIYLAKKIYLT